MNPRVSITTANERTQGFELAITWYSPSDETLEKWTKRVMIFGFKRAIGFFRDTNQNRFGACLSTTHCCLIVFRTKLGQLVQNAAPLFVAMIWSYLQRRGYSIDSGYFASRVAT
jgi:hypothetical protein